VSDRPSEDSRLPAGKLPAGFLREILGSLAQPDDVILGPGIGHDVAVIDLGTTLLVAKSDPITFATDHIGWYAVNVNANDIATAGAAPKWFLVTLLLPEGDADTAMVERIMADLVDAANSLGVSIVGGHTEITSGIDRPIVSGTMLGTVRRGELVRPDGMRPGDVVLLTKGMAIEATSIVAREMTDRLLDAGMPPDRVDDAARCLIDPGISVVRDGRLARQAARSVGESIHALHDPTEGGVVTAMDELAEAAGVDIEVDADLLSEAVEPLCREVCDAVGIDVRGAISSGALLIALPPEAADAVTRALREEMIAVYRVGRAVAGSGVCRFSDNAAADWPVFPRDEIARLFSE